MTIAPIWTDWTDSGGTDQFSVSCVVVVSLCFSFFFFFFFSLSPKDYKIEQKCLLCFLFISTEITLFCFRSRFLFRSLDRTQSRFYDVSKTKKKRRFHIVQCRALLFQSASYLLCHAIVFNFRFPASLTISRPLADLTLPMMEGVRGQFFWLIFICSD